MRKPIEIPGSLRPAVLLLAAGSSRRFGSDKRRAVFDQQRSLLGASLQLYLELKLDVFVCLSDGDRDRELAADLPAGAARVLFCCQSHRGMGATLAQATANCRDYPALLIALADMPLLAPDTVRSLCDSAAQERIVYPVYDGRRGNPVVFGRAFYPELQALDGDRGAAGIIAAHPRETLAIGVNDPAIHLDVDTPAALRQLRERAGA
jgi:molybdenum cofactor cytidylyltransferase